MKKTIKKKLAKMRGTPKKKSAKKKVAPKKAEMKIKVGNKKTTGGKAAGARKKRVQGKSQGVETAALALEGLGARSGEQSGDLQALSNVQGHANLEFREPSQADSVSRRAILGHQP